MYSEEPADPRAYTSDFDATYSRFGMLYDWLVRHTSLWKAWVGPALAHIRGQRVLEVSFGTGWLLAQYASQFEAYGIDLNARMIEIATRNLAAVGAQCPLQVADVEALPYRSGSFDTVVNTMAFSGYPRADRAMKELHRVLTPGGRLVLIDIGPPADENLLGNALLWFWIRTGDIVRDMGGILERFGFCYWHRAIGGFGSVHLYVADKP